MGSSGFRPPQFSEELAWLPAYLQRITDTSVEPRSPSHQQFKELSCVQGEDLELLLWREESRCNSFHLFLSGEDKSPISSFPSSKDVLNFRLHLSPDSDSPYCQSQFLSTSCAQHGSDRVLQLPQVVSSGSGDQIDLIKTKIGAGGVNALPLTSIARAVENDGPQLSNHVKACSEHSVEKVTVRNLKGIDIMDAVELSIAASETLVIHELVKSDPASEAFSTAAVLEAALQVKQARLEISEDAFDCSSEKSDEIDFLLDLDDLTMADAFEDVGLSIRGLDDQHACGSDESLVKDTPVSENCFGSENISKNAEHFSQNKSSNDPSFGLRISDFTGNSDPMLHKLGQEISHVSATVQRVGFSIVDTSVQPQADVNCSAFWNLENAGGESNASPSIADGFRSRWFGGWAGKEEADPVQLKPKGKNIPKYFAAETSFFSESADVAPDENSVVLKCEKNRSKIASDQSIPFEGLYDQVDEGIMVSQDVRSSNLSLVDPLCSIVPCSISSENDSSALGHKGNSEEANVGNCFGSTAVLGNENLDGESTYGTRQALPTFCGEHSVAKVRRRLTSLRTYSTVLHEHDSTLGSERLCLNQSTSLNLRHNMNGIRFSDKRNSEMSLAASSTPECTIGRDTEENKHTTVVDNPDGETTNYKQNSDKHAKDGAALQDQPSRGSSPLILHQRMRQRLQAARLLVCGSLGKANAEQAVAQKASVALSSRSSLQWIQSKCNNAFDMQFPSRKRVHFSEIEVNLQRNKNLHERQPFHQKCSVSRPSKRFKPDAEILDDKRFSTIHFRDQKSLIFQDLKFLLTGFSRGKEKEIEGLIRKYGGVVLVDIPSPSNRGKRCSRLKFLQLPIVLCPKKLQTTKFLYACAVNSLILKVKWLTDSIAAGSALSPGKYMVLLNQPDTRFTRIGKPVRQDNYTYIFDGIGIMLHGKQLFCTKFAKVIQHGGGRVFKTLLWLLQNLDNEKISLAVIVSEGESKASRHLRHCASERKIPMMPSSWIVRSLYSGKLLPFVEKKDTTLHAAMGTDFLVSDDWSQEI
ncbi:Uncharacterized protein TCM_044754 isoform 1 [Theobroma cacao]|uniref:Uncharacterized protein isoform 1 n=2 Tax=Theobroma cacao TaxID=3641 RepID=A0A061FRU5_THECC|nr:Uncharacterized protein TCM_044754 isoform 1 [Theobroma cacao]EOY19618.1 Uncharacterized protein TCM_044754 isoform 1 [Theobroma cacao]